MFNRRAHLSVIGGWREATQVGFYGIGTNTSKDDRTNYLFQQPYGNALLTVFPARGPACCAAASSSRDGRRSLARARFPRLRPVHARRLAGPRCRGHLPAHPGHRRVRLAHVARLHADAAASTASRCTITTIETTSSAFRSLEYEAIQHVPILREAWVLSFRGRVQTADEKDGQQIPFFMLPALGGGSTLRGYSSWRFRDQNSLLLQAEWRIMVNRYLDLAFFYDAGKVAARTSDLDLDGLKDDFGFGVRFHGPFATPLRVELARSREGISFIFSSSAVFLRSRLMFTSTCLATCRVAPGSWLFRSVPLVSLPPAPRRRARASIRTIRSRASPNRRTPRRRRPTTSRRCTSCSTTCSSRPATSRAACARRTSTRSTKCRTRAGSPTASAPGRSRLTSSFAGRTSARRPIRRSGC